MKIIVLVALLMAVTCSANARGDTVASGAYTYRQGFVPGEAVIIDLSKTALFVADPQNNFLSENSQARGQVGPGVAEIEQFIDEWCECDGRDKDG